MSSFVNIAAYKFAKLSDLKERRAALITFCKELSLKGTILLSTEGINLFVAGAKDAMEKLLAYLRSIPGLEDLTPKISESEEQPFTRMLVRIKKEIIAFGVEGIDPAAHTSPKLPPSTLKQWLDEGRPITLLDTRNDYEVTLGTFHNALTLGIDHFRHFPEAVRALSPDLKQQPIVMFCTGGIRCEKAGPFMEREGFEKIYQLEGGILKYFEDCGGDHYDGECFVFDQRVGVDPALKETESVQCYACQTPLTADQADPRYRVNVSCPYCYKTTEQHIAEAVAARQQKVDALIHPLPGSAPYVNRRPLHIPEAYDGQRFLDVLASIFPHIGREEWLRRCSEGRFVTQEGEIWGVDQVVRAGQHCYQIFPEAAEPAVNGAIRILHEDEAIVVLHKPAPLPMHPGGRYNRNTLQYIMDEAYAPQRPRFAHRLDANTSGLIVGARTRHFAALLQQQFIKGHVVKTYLAQVQGSPPQDTFECAAPISAQPRTLGSRNVDPEEGQPALTRFQVIERRADGTTLLQAQPITGRTNQIRIHLWHLGFPVIGDNTYKADQEIGDQQTIELDAPPLRLLAWKLEFRHPIEDHWLAFEAARPDWAQ